MWEKCVVSGMRENEVGSVVLLNVGQQESCLECENKFIVRLPKRGKMFPFVRLKLIELAIGKFSHELNSIIDNVTGHRKTNSNFTFTNNLILESQ